MNTTTIHHGRDERPEAVEQAEAGAKAWRTAGHAQRMAPPEHSDFYALAGDLADTLAAVAGLAEVLAWQVAHYSDGRPVCDDSRVVDPRERLDAAALDLHELAARARHAARSAHTFWSRIGHVGVDDQAAAVAAGRVAGVTR